VNGAEQVNELAAETALVKIDALTIDYRAASFAIFECA
jgi:hypothetical protein